METIDEQTKYELPDSSGNISENVRICLTGNTAKNSIIVEGAQSFGVPIVISDDGQPYVLDHEWQTVFVVEHFDGPIFDALQEQKMSIVGPPALLKAATMEQSLTLNARPVYNYAMRGVATCFTGLRNRDELTRVVHLIHSMGGTIRKEMSTKITHLISKQSCGDKYQYAKTFRLTVVRPAWVLAAWERRDEVDFVATTNEFSADHMLKVFEGRKITFQGFPEEERLHMIDVLLSNGGLPTDISDHECTHVVVDEHTTQAKPDVPNSATHVVKSEWFWYSIQNGFADETDYHFGDYLDNMANTPDTDRRDSLPISFNRRKRKRFSQLLQKDSTPLSSGKRRSSISDAGMLSVSSSFFDTTTSPDKLESSKHVAYPDECKTFTPSSKQETDNRYNFFTDLLTTESNYVGILDSIFKLFKEPLEEWAGTPDEILNKSEIKEIFQNFLPISELHKQMLERYHAINNNWRDDCLIGEIILQHQDDLMRAYPPYVNYFEQMTNSLVQFDTSNPRFHAFLKINQTKPECGRHSLKDLMIKPVQRLPHITLILQNLCKHTKKDNPDHALLKDAEMAVNAVLTYINEGKRKIDCHREIFGIFNLIEGCPAHIISSHRKCISRCDVTALTESDWDRGSALTLFLFTDLLFVCKKKSRHLHTAKSPSANKTYKFLSQIPLNTIRFVVNLTDSPNAFALVRRQDNKQLESFQIVDEEIRKDDYVKTLCQQMAVSEFRTDAEKTLLYRSSQDIHVDISDTNLSTLSKAFRLAAKTRIKVGRAFSFNKTPAKLKRAVSTIIPSPFGSTNNLTPSRQLEQMRLASYTNIHEATDEESQSTRSNSPSLQTEPLVTPQTIQSSRRNNKISTLPNIGRF